MIRHDAALSLGAGALDFDLPAHDRTRLDEHLATCAACRRRVHDLRVDAGALADLPVRPLSPRRADDILTRALAEPRRTVEPVRLVLVVALLALLALGSLAIGAEMVRRLQQDDLSVVVPPVPTQSAEPAPSGGAPVPSGGPAPSGAPAWGDSGVGTAWQRVEVPETALIIPGGGAMSGVIAGGPGAIAWGQVYGAGPRIWTATDGRSWELATIEAPADPDPEALTPGNVSDVTAGGPGYIAVGYYDRLGTGRRAVVWTSTDGLTWSLLAHDPLFEHALMYRILPWQGRLWIFGNAGFGAGGGATEPLAWSSADGATWQSETLSLPDGKGLSVIDAAGDVLWGTLYALGDDLGMEPLVMATSTDGRAWTPSVLPVPRASSMHVVDGDLVLLAVPVSGSTSTPAPGVYRSTDGRTWEALVTGSATVGNDIIDAGGTLIMVGDDAKGDGACGAGCHAAGWRSVDGGKTWTLVTTDTAGGLMDTVTALPDRTLVAVGRVIDGKGNATLGAWVSPPAELPAATPGPSPVPTATPAATPAAADLGADLTWTAAPVTASLKDAAMMAVATGPDRYVAVGCTGQGALDASACTGSAWTSADGVTWALATVPDADHLYLQGVISSPAGYLAWAYDTGTSPGAAFWQSDDGRVWRRAPYIPSFGYNNVSQVVWFGDRFAAFSDWNEQRIWTSPDGLHWADQADAMGCDGGQVSAPDGLGGPAVVLVDGSEIVTVATVYVAPPEGADPSSGEYRRVVSRSKDVRCWTVTSTPSPAWAFGAVQAAGGLVAVGRRHDLPGAGAGSASPGGAASTSVDGTRWVASTFDGGIPNGELSLVASGDRGLLALGSPDGGGLSGWRSTDGRAWLQAASPDAGTTAFASLIAIPGGFMAVGQSTAPGGSMTAQVWIAR